MSALVAVAEKLRQAGAALEEAAKLTEPGAVAESLGWTAVFSTDALRINSFWGVFAKDAGAEYEAWVSTGCPRTPELLLGDIHSLLLQMPKADLDRLAADERFARLGVGCLVAARDILTEGGRD